MNSLAQTNITRHAQVDLIENDDEIKDKEAELKKIEERIRGINSAAPIYRTKQSAVDVKNVINLDAFSLDRVLSFDPEFLNTEGCVTFPHSTVESVSPNALSAAGPRDALQRVCTAPECVQHLLYTSYKHLGMRCF